VPELGGKTLGILGYGRIGQAVARRARAFDMTVRAIRQAPSGASVEGLASLSGPEGLDALLREADYLAVTLALTPETRGMLGARELGLMKRSAVLVNVARGEVVDEDALYDALAGGGIAGAALDVWYRYPAAPGPTLPSRRPFHELRNVLMTPHVSGWTEGMLQARAAVIAGNVERVARGEAPLNFVA
jgi:phosphoglycerate dehydrogenase-like enzyme